MNGRKYRKLTGAEIAVLEANNCSARDWEEIEVVEGFTPYSIRDCGFRGRVRIGANVSIDTVWNGIENYEIGDGVTIQNVESMYCSAGNRFGNGVRVAVLNESGGREVPIYNGLTAQTAYILAMYRHRPDVISALEKLIDTEVKTNTPALGQIGARTTITHCGKLNNLRIGEDAILDGVAELHNGTVNSAPESPTRIGRGVIARNFIATDAVEITDYAQIDTCFIGQGCRVGKGFTAEQSLFFANCECLQGEACSVFAGPYTVTHHKSSLLIGGMFSFYNAGSGTNQSNHMYRLGPVHQGVLDRGSKTGSSSYILFPARIGAFSVVTGRHYSHPDTASLPFSYLLEENRRSVLSPGTNLRSIGLARDIRKWPERDRRTGTKSDLIRFDMLNPYTVGKIREGIGLLKQMAAESQSEYNGVTIFPSAAAKGIKSYELALRLFTGEALAAQIRKNGRNIPASRKPLSHWNDLAGLVAPSEKIADLLDSIPRMSAIGELTSAFTKIAANYAGWCWEYAAEMLEEEVKKPFADFTADDLAAILRSYTDALAEYEKWVVEDAAKEFGEKMRAGYGLGDGPGERDAEFTAIHGRPEEQAFVKRLREETREKISDVQALIDKRLKE